MVEQPREEHVGSVTHAAALLILIATAAGPMQPSPPAERSGREPATTPSAKLDAARQAFLDAMRCDPAYAPIETPIPVSGAAAANRLMSEIAAWKRGGSAVPSIRCEPKP